jgi:enoyl-CoA hydratase
MIEIDHRDGVSILRLDRPPVNAMDVELLAALTAAMRGLDGPVVITGTGRTFSAGVDLRRVLGEDGAYAERLLAALADAFRAVFDHPAPTVAALNGAAVAGGCVLALACDVRLMAAGRIGLTELAVGVPFPGAGVAVARHALGSAAARVVLRAQTFDVEEAVRLGLVDEQVPGEALLGRALSLAAGMAPAPAAYALVKRQLHEPVTAALADADDSAAAAIWSAPDTRQRIREQLESLRRARP